MQIIRSIQNRIYEIRGEKVMLDFDLAALYEVETKVLNQSVKRNSKRFPADFMFRLTIVEWETIRLQFVTASQGKRNVGVTPHAFAEQGIAMLSDVLNSDKAINMPARPTPVGRKYRHYACLRRNKKGCFTAE